MQSIDTLTEVILYVEDIERMTDFYREVFGLEIQDGAVEHGFVRFDTGGTDLCLHAGRDGELGEFAPKPVFEVADIEAAHQHLREADVEVGDEIRSPVPGRRILDGRDPEGNRFSLESHDEP